MNSKGNFILATIWILAAPLCFWAENTGMGTLFLCMGVAMGIIGLVRRNQEKKGK